MPTNGPPPRARLTIAQRALRAGNHRAALAELDAIAGQMDNEPAYHEARLAACAGLNKSADALASARRLVQLDPKNPAARVRFGVGLQQAGEPAQALDQFQAALRRDPNHYEARRWQASALMDLGRYPEAGAALDALAASPAVVAMPATQRLDFAILYARCAPKGVDAAKAIDTLRAQLTPDVGSWRIRQRGWWTLARLYDRVDRVGDAVNAYERAHAEDPTPWHPERFEAWADELIAGWDACTVPPLPDGGERLVFVVGMMRSGTSLTEQMLAQADDVTPGGELGVIPGAYALVQQGPRPIETPFVADIGTRLDADLLGRVRAHTDEGFSRVSETGFVTDKQPFNALSVPLIARAYPNAKIVRCHRDPLDVCISNYTQLFRTPNPYTKDQTHLARYCRTYERVLDAFAGSHDMVDLRYEQLVAEPEATTRALFAALGWAWTPRVLDFHESDRVVATASRDQVREPLNARSVGRAARYGDHFAELERALHDA